jgi:predicted regulator of Ras-like GTPase activity (Roadblock/LC7/MglB family)
MSLTDILNEALDAIPGARFAGVVGTDGLSVEMVFEDQDDGFDIGLAELELGALAAGATAASLRLGTGRVQDMLVETEGMAYLGSIVSPGYFAVLGLPADANLGRARFVVQQIVARIKDEL